MKNFFIGAMQSKISVYDIDGKTTVSSIDKPKLFDVELRGDLVRMVYDCVRQNKRQAYAVSPEAGMQHSAESWGTGRAGQAAFANFARKGRMAHPTQVHRRWHRKTPLNTRRMATLMGVVASANAALVEGRGHRIGKVENLPIVLSDKMQEIRKTKEAVELIKTLGLYEDVERVKNSRTITCGKGKYRNRRYNQRKGILVVHTGETLSSFRNIEGVDFVNVDSMSVLDLCPGGKMGRLVIWKESAFKRLESLFSEECKKNFSLPNRMIENANLEDYFYSPEIQSLIKLPSFLPPGTCKKSEEEISTAENLIAMYKAE
ncbi:hypothetical protein NUSPORA_01559 [Nucleospora cyclopteri]